MCLCGGIPSDDVELSNDSRGSKCGECPPKEGPCDREAGGVDVGKLIVRVGDRWEEWLVEEGMLHCVRC